MTTSPMVSPIDHFGIDRLSLQAHIDLHRSILALINEQGPAALHLVPHLDTYAALIELEQGYVHHNSTKDLSFYLPARYTTDRQLERLINVTYTFYNVVPTTEIETFILRLRRMLQEAG